MSNSFATPLAVAARLLCPWAFPGKNTGVGCQCPSPGDLCDPGIKPKSPALAGRFSTTEPPGKPKIKIKQMKVEREKSSFKETEGHTDQGKTRPWYKHSYRMYLSEKKGPGGEVRTHVLFI